MSDYDGIFNNYHVTIFPCRGIRITLNVPQRQQPCTPDCPFNRKGKCITSVCLFRRLKHDNLEPAKIGEKESGLASSTSS